ncbi:hypothetical protein VaNZ11_013496 [Volvox africanus]|uniref:EF-hand domain-containing protein n=1 Tax=Volvox africanus TaxID=51714 RepID=A0ABQ5SHM4_9CHLO|nr:hypothetical protein VaNZ11_013496 [Volvox africanus]
MEETSRKKDRSITWQAYLPSDVKQDILEIYERLDAERKGYITQQQLHTALNEAFGKPIRTETVRTLATRMDITSRHGLKISYNDFLEYMAQKLLSAESYDDLLRSEQGPLMQEVGYKVYELLERFKRKQMLKDAMAGGDGIQRLLHFTAAPFAHRNRRKGQLGIDLMSGESGTNGSKTGGPSVHRRHGGGGGSATRAEGGMGSRTIGDANFVSRSSLVSRRSSVTGAENHSSSLVQPSAGAPTRSSNARISSRPPHSHQGRNSAPAARASSALASLLSRADGPDADQAAGISVEDRGSAQRWRKSTSHTAEGVQPTAWQGQGDPAMPLKELNPPSGAAATTSGLPGTDKDPNHDASRLLSPHTSVPNTSGGLQPGGLQTMISVTVGETNPWPQKRLVPVSAGASVPAVATMPAPVSRSSMATSAISIPGRVGSRVSSPALNPVGVNGSVPLPTSPVGSKAEGWRSAALMAQVLEIERIDVHSLVMEDLRATVGLSTSPIQPRAQLRPQQSQPLLHQLSSSHPLQHPPSTLQLQPQQSQGQPQQPLHTRSALQGRSDALPLQPPTLEDGNRTCGVLTTDFDTCERSADAPAEGVTMRPHRAESHTQAPPSSLPPTQQRQPQRQPQQPSSTSVQPPVVQPPWSPQSRPQNSNPMLLQPQAQSQMQLKNQAQNGIAERRREGEPVGAWVSVDPEGALGLLLRGSLSSGGQPRNRPRFHAVSAPEALRLDVPVPIESDPLLAKLPDWVRKGIGLPPAPVVRVMESEPGAQPIPLASAPATLTVLSIVASEPPCGSDSDARQPDASSGRRGGRAAQPEAGVGHDDSGEIPGENDTSAISAQSSNGLRPMDSSGSHRPMVSRGFSLTRQSTTRFVPFGGDTAAVVAEAAEEGESGMAADSENSLSHEPSALEELQKTSNAVECPPIPEACSPRAQISSGLQQLHSPNNHTNPSAASAALCGQVIRQPELLTPGFTSFRKSVASCPGNPDASAVGPPVGSGAGDGDWLGLEAEAEANRESLAAWEESVLLPRSRDGHDTLQVGEQVSKEGHEREGQENDDGSDNDDETMMLYERLMARSMRSCSSLRRAPLGAKEITALAAHNEHHEPQVNAHGQQGAQQDFQSQASFLQQLQLQQAGNPQMPAEVEDSIVCEQSLPDEEQNRQRQPAAQGQKEVSASGQMEYLSAALDSRSPGVQVNGLQSQPMLQGLPPRRFFSQVRPRSAALLPSAAAVVSAASAAATMRSSDDGAQASGGSFWSADYVSCSDGAVAGRAHVRLNHTAMLRLHKKYGSELIAAAGAALGLGGSSAAARAVASRELLQALTSHGSGRIVGTSSFAAKRTSAPSSSSLPSPHYITAASTCAVLTTATVSAPVPSECVAQPRRTSSSTGAGEDLLCQTSGSGIYLPHDAVGLGRQIMRQKSQRSTESGAGGSCGGGSASGPNSVPRPASAKAPRNPVYRQTNATHDSAVIAAAHTQAGRVVTSPPSVACAAATSTNSPVHLQPHTRMYPAPVPRMPVASGSGLLRPASAAPNRQAPGRSASASIPSPTITIPRLRKMDESEVSSCFTTLVVANNVMADISRPAHRSSGRPSQPPSSVPSVRSAPIPTLSAQSPSMPAKGVGLLAGDRRAAGRTGSGMGSSGGGASSGGTSVHSGSASSSAGSRGTVVTVEGSSGEERLRRQLEVMGTVALLPAHSGCEMEAPGGIAPGRRIAAVLARSR